MKENKEKRGDFAKSHARIEKRQNEADQRESARLNRTPKQQLAVLDKRLGKGKGAKKEREKLLKLI